LRSDDEGVRASLSVVAGQLELTDRAERIGVAAYWELLTNLTRREIKGRYSQSLFGIGWAIAQPLATMAVFTFVFSRLGNISADGVPYPIFAYAGLVPWFFVLNSVTSGTMSLITYRNIVTKTYFPREIIPFAQVASRLLDFFAAAGLFALLMIYHGVPLTRWALLAPVMFVLLVLFTTGVTLLTSSLNVFYRDVSPVVQIGLQLWLYVTPIAYPLSKVPESWRPLIAANPLSGIVEGFRSVLLYGRAPDWELLGLSAALTATVFAGAFVLFKKIDKYFADVI
jgi:ABC-type polysaccharide/polyol phosphate export permease